MKNFAKNAASLYAVQLSQFILPLLVLPYLTRVLGPDAFGLFIFAQAYGLFLAVFIEYGFNMSGTRSIIQQVDEGGRLQKIYGVVGAQISLLIIVLPLSLLVVYLVPQLRENFLLLMMGTLLGVTVGLRNYWYFLSIEKLLIPAITSVFISALYITGVFVLVKGPNDIPVLLSVQITTQFIGLIILYSIMMKQVGVAAIRIKEIKIAMNEGWSLFLSSLSVNLYTKINAFILGLVSVPAQVGFFGASDKLVRAANRMQIPLAELFFPKMNKLINQKSDNAEVMISRIFWIMLSVSSLLSLGIIITAPWVIPFILGEGYDPAILLAQLLSLSLPLIAVSNVLGTQWMIPKGFDKAYRKVIISTAVLNVIAAPIMAYYFGAIGMVINVVCIELIVVAGFYISLGKNRPKILRVA